MTKDISVSNPQKDFLAHRRAQEANTVSKIEDDPNNPLHSVMTIEFNTTELCNRTCVFCPRVNPDIYPNRNLHFSKELASKVAKDLADFGFKGRISFSGFGEPILNKSFPDLIRAVREHLPDNWIDTNTNGDRLTAKMLHQLFDAGITTIYVNMYDGPEQREPFEAVFKEAGIPEDKYKLRPHWGGADEDYGLILNNRSGMITDPDLGMPVIAEPITHPCFYPFSRALVDWDGKVLICSNDWGRACVVGDVSKDSFADVWMSDAMLEVRKKLMQGDRKHKPCVTCNVNGTLSGRFGYDLLIDYYKQQGLIDKGLVPMEPLG